METDDGRTRQTRSDGQAGRTAERRAAARGAMRRSRVQGGDDHPALGFRKLSGIHRNDGLGDPDFKGRLLNTHIVEPDDTPFAVGNLGPVLIVWGEVSMGDGMGMAGIRLVDMFRRDG